MYLSSTKGKDLFKEAKEDKILSNLMNGLCNRKHLILNKNTYQERVYHYQQLGYIKYNIDLIMKPSLTFKESDFHYSKSGFFIDFLFSFGSLSS